MDLTLETPPAQLPLDLDVVKQHVRIFHDEHDLLLQGLIEAVTSNLDGRDGILGRALITQVWDLKLALFPSYGSRLSIPFPPLQTVQSIKYLDADGLEQTLDPQSYQVLTGGYCGAVHPMDRKDWPRHLSSNAFPVTVRFKAGYGDNPANVPAALRQAMLLIIGNLYICPEDQRKNKMNASGHLLAPWRIGEMAI